MDRAVESTAATRSGTGQHRAVDARSSGDADWTATALTDGDILRMPELGIEVPVAAFYDGTDIGPLQDEPGEGAG